MKLSLLHLSVSVMGAASATGPCDIVGTAGNPCIAAHSSVRALYATYDGPLYAVKNNHSGEVANVSTLKPGGFADAKAHELLCPATGVCIIQTVFDQAGNGNHLRVRDDRDIGGVQHFGVDASKHKVYVGGDHTPVYGMYFDVGHGYNANKTTGVATGNDPETIFAVMTGRRWGGYCCFDYGNSETTRKDDGSGTMGGCLALTRLSVAVRRTLSDSLSLLVMCMQRRFTSAVPTGQTRTTEALPTTLAQNSPAATAGQRGRGCVLRRVITAVAPGSARTLRLVCTMAVDSMAPTNRASL